MQEISAFELETLSYTLQLAEGLSWHYPLPFLDFG